MTPAGLSGSDANALETWPSLPLTDEQSQLARVIGDIGRQAPAGRRDASDATTPGALASLDETGLLSLALPESSGGSDAGLPTLVLAVHELAKHNPVSALAVLHNHAARRAKPDVSSATTGLMLFARVLRLESGALARLDVGLPAVAVALVDGHDVAVTDLADSGLAGLTPARRTGLYGLGTALADIPVPTSGWRTAPGDAAAAGNTWRLGIAAAAAGIAHAAAASALRYSREREQFGGPLIALPAVRERLATLTVAAATSWTAVWSAAHDPLVTAPSRSAAVSLLARDSTRSARAATSAALGVHGGYGYLTEYPVARHLADSITLCALASAGPTEQDS